MSGIIGHVTYALLGHRAVQQRGLPVAATIAQHFDNYLAGCYLAADVMTLPAAVCPRCGGEYGYASAMTVTVCPEDGARLVSYQLEHDGTAYTPEEIHRLFYGRTHLLFGWNEAESGMAVRWEELPQFLTAVVADTQRLFGPGDRPLAYVCGWMSHLIGDAMIKSVLPGLDLHLLNGTYTPENRPIQDLYCFHEVGRKESGIDWTARLAGIVNTPAEPVQAHFMRMAAPCGRLAADFPHGWRPEWESLVLRVMTENRWYQAIRNPRILAALEAPDGAPAPVRDPEQRPLPDGLTREGAFRMAEEAGFRAALNQIAEKQADLFDTVFANSPDADR